jgi:tetratricopeptide (TPR) repeat protein
MSKFSCKGFKAGVFFLRLGIYLLRPPYRSFRLKAEQFCESQLRKDETDSSSRWLLGNLYVGRKEYASAREHLERLVAEGKLQRRVLLLLSEVYFNLEEHESVERILNGGDLLSAKDTGNYYLGYSLLKLGKFNEAAKFLAVYTARHSKNWQPFVHLGYAFFKAGLYRQAIQSYETAERLNPSALDIKNSIALCREKLVEAGLKEKGT